LQLPLTTTTHPDALRELLATFSHTLMGAEAAARAHDLTCLRRRVHEHGHWNRSRLGRVPYQATAPSTLTSSLTARVTGFAETAHKSGYPSGRVDEADRRRIWRRAGADDRAGTWIPNRPDETGKGW